MRFNLSANIESINYREDNPPEIKIIQQGYRASIDFRVLENQNGEQNYPNGLKKNDLIYLENVIIMSNYKGELSVKIDPFTNLL